MIALECVYECRHPLWGGAGNCSQQNSLTGYECSCDASYSSIDSFGNASCVSKRALVAWYTLVAVCGGMTVGFLLWAAVKQQRLPEQAQVGRRAVLRMRLICSVSVYSGSGSLAFLVVAVRGGNTTLYDSGMLQVIYSVTMPMACASVALLVDLWVNTLPCQLLPKDSAAVRIIRLAEERHLFIWVGCLYIAGITPFGVMTFFVLDTLKVIRAINLVTGMTAASGILLLIFVCVNFTGIINKAKQKATGSSAAYYASAIKTLRIQVAALSSAALAWLVMAVLLEPKLGGVGANTPEIPLSIMLLGACVGFGLSVHFAKAGPTRGPSSPQRPSGPQASSVWSPGGGLREKISGVGVKAKATTLIALKPIRFARGPDGGRRVVPAVLSEG
ncbi:unnamed protein product [Ectocarpus sp. 12 AP-2014]